MFRLTPIAAALALAACAHSPASRAPDLREPLTMSTLEAGACTIHTAVAGRVGAGAATHIVETDDGLVVFDPQQFPKYAQAVRRYADRLGKPITHVIVTHHAADHVGGLEAFADRDTYALPATRAQLPEGLIDHPLRLGESRIGGLTYHFEAVALGAAGVSLVARIPEAHTAILQNVLDTRGLAPAEGLEARRLYLEVLAADPDGYRHFLAGHGPPVDAPGLAAALADLRHLADAQGTVVGVHRP